VLNTFTMRTRVSYSLKNGQNYFMCDPRNSQIIRSLYMFDDYDVIIYSRQSEFSVDDLTQRIEIPFGLGNNFPPRISEFSDNSLYDLSKKLIIFSERTQMPMELLNKSLDKKVKKIIEELKFLRRLQNSYFNSLS